jgi:hypothetical protein
MSLARGFHRLGIAAAVLAAIATSAGAEDTRIFLTCRGVQTVEYRQTTKYPDAEPTQTGPWEDSILIDLKLGVIGSQAAQPEFPGGTITMTSDTEILWKSTLEDFITGRMDRVSGRMHAVQGYGHGAYEFRFKITYEGTCTKKDRLF